MEVDFSKKFSVGLPLNTTIEKFEEFLYQYDELLGSVYFSFPLGQRFYSRTELEREFENDGVEEKFLRFISLLKKHNIRTELAVNTFGLTESDLQLLVRYAQNNSIQLDEIVCLAQYGNILKSAFPDAEMKFSFNNTFGKVPDLFDTVVLGKEYLRNCVKRHTWLNTGKRIVLLLNNGCSYNCHYECGDAQFCGAILSHNLQESSINYLYAQQSFFPFELQKMAESDEHFNEYSFKISNRPLGLEYTKKALHSYSQFVNIDILVNENIENYGLFCTMGQLFAKRKQFQLDEIMRIKNELSV